MARVFTDAQVAAALRDAKGATAPGVPLPSLALDASAHAPQEATDAIPILVSPERALSVNVNARDALGFRPGLVATRDKRTASLLQSADGWEIAIDDAPATTIDRLMPELGLDGAHASGPKLTLDLAGFAALVAAADVLQRARLEARLDRRHLPPPALTPRALEKSLAHGLATGDPRWAVCATRWLAPVSLKGARGRLKEGLRAIDGPGIEIAAALADLQGGAGVTALAWDQGARHVRGHGIVLGTRRGGWWFEWSGVPVAPHVKVTPVGVAEVRGKLVGWL